MDIVTCNAAVFLEKYGHLYKVGFNLSDNVMISLNELEAFQNKKFFILFIGSDVAAFFSLREIDLNKYELGDVLKVKFKLRRAVFSEFLKAVCEDSLYHQVIGFPNAQALQLELMAGFQVINRYHKQVVLVLPLLSIFLPIYQSRNGLRFKSSLLKLEFGQRYKKCLFRRFLKKSVDGKLFNFGISVHYYEDFRGNWEFISWQGVSTELPPFHLSDNSF